MIRRLLWRFKDSKYNNPIFIAVLGFGIVILVVIVAFIISLFGRLSNEDQVYNDPLSGETVYTPKDRTPERFNAGDQVTYLGFAELIDYGLSFSDVQSLKDVIQNIPEDTDQVERIREVSIDVKSVKHTITSSAHEYSFRMRTNRKTDYTGTITVQKSNGFFSFAMKNAENRVVFDSAKSH